MKHRLNSDQPIKTKQKKDGSTKLLIPTVRKDQDLFAATSKPYICNSITQKKQLIQSMSDINPDYPTPSNELCKQWMQEGWKHGYEHAFKLASNWGYKQRLYKEIGDEFGTPQVDIKEMNSTLIR